MEDRRMVSNGRNQRIRLWRNQLSLGARGVHPSTEQEISTPRVAKATATNTTPSPQQDGREVPEGIRAVSAPNESELVRKLDRLVRGEAVSSDPTERICAAAAFENKEERNAQIDRVRKAVGKGRGYDLLRVRRNPR